MRNWLLFLACCPAALAQLDSNVLTVTATRSLNLQPDQASLLVNVTSNENTVLDDVLAALQPANITAANFTGVSTTEGNSAILTQEAWYWSFTLTVPLAGLKGTLASLSMLQQSLLAAQNPMTVGYYVQSASFSPQLLASNPCPYTAVFSDAQTQGQTVATAAGITLGPVVGLSDGSGTVTQPAVEYATGAIIAIVELGSVLQQSGYVSSFLPAPSAPSCTLVVQFKLGQ